MQMKFRFERVEREKTANLTQEWMAGFVFRHQNKLLTAAKAFAAQFKEIEKKAPQWNKNNFNWLRLAEMAGIELKPQKKLAVILRISFNFW